MQSQQPIMQTQGQQAMQQGGIPQTMSTQQTSALSSAESQLIGFGALMINVLDARGLRRKDMFSESDAYCVLSVVERSFMQPGNSRKKDDLRSLGQQVSTAAVTNSSNPAWNQSFTLAVRNAEADVLRIRVYDHDRSSKDDLIGEAFIPLIGLANGQQADQWVQLSGRVNKAQIDGAVHLRMSLMMPGQSMAGGAGSHVMGCPFVVSVIEGRKLARKDLASPSDPYVKLHIVSSHSTTQPEKRHLFRKKSRGPTGQELRTNACLNTTTPLWNETFQLISADPMADQLSVLCYDKDDAKKDDFIGEALVPLAGLAQGNTSDLWVRLNGRVGQFDGAIHLVLKPLQHPNMRSPMPGQQQFMQQQQQQQQLQQQPIGQQQQQPIMQQQQPIMQQQQPVMQQQQPIMQQHQPMDPKLVQQPPTQFANAL